MQKLLLIILATLLQVALAFSSSAEGSPLTTKFNNCTALNIEKTHDIVDIDECNEIAYDFTEQGNVLALPGAALHFDGANDYISITDAPENNFSSTNEFTVDFWCKVNSNSGDGVFVNKGGGGSLEQYSFDLFGSNFRYYISAGSSMYTVLSMPRPTVAEGWVHIVGTYNGATGEMYLYKNGVLATSSTSALSTLQNTANPLAFGIQAPPSFNQPLNGVLDEVRLWNRELCLDEILAYGNCEITGSEPGLTAYYNFNQGIAGGANTIDTTLTDITGNGNNGNLTNFALTGTTSNWIEPGGVTTGITCAPLPSVGTAPLDVCTSFSAVVTPGGGWTFINDGSGNAIASIDAPVGVDLGTVTVEVLRHGTTQTYGNETANILKLLPRYYHVSSSNYASNAAFPSNVGVRFYFTEAELAMMNAANMGDNGVTSHSASSIVLTHYNGSNEDCDYLNNNGLITDTNVLLGTPVYSNYGCTDHCLEVSIGHFSEFIPHEPSVTPLPIELNDFTATAIENELVRLNWTTSSEFNNQGFDVEKSTDGREWKALQFVPGAGTSTAVNTYSFDDLNPQRGSNYYRLKQMNLDESFQYSDIRVVDFYQTDHFIVFPNPTKGETVHIGFSRSTKGTLSVYNLQGKLIHQVILNEEQKQFEIDLPKTIPTGLYFIEFVNNDAKLVQKLLIK